MWGNDYIMDEIRRLSECIAKEVFNVESDDTDIFDEYDSIDIGTLINKDKIGSGCDKPE